MSKRGVVRGSPASKLTFLILLTLPILYNAAPILEVSRAGVQDGKILPKNYEILIRPDYNKSFDEMTNFAGRVSIVLTLEEPRNESSSIILNAAEDIEVLDVELIKEYSDMESGGQATMNTTFEQQRESEILIISFESLGIGRYTLVITYKGLLTPNDTVGFYKSAYTTTVDGKEETRYILTTQFEPTHARKAFPCFDEPSFKATFNVSVVVPEGYSALGNNEVENKTTDESELTTIRFKETTLMSTYLVAFIIYEQESFKPTTTATLESNVRITAWGPKEAVETHLLEFSQVVSQQSITALENFTNIPYNIGAGMEKIDQVSVKEYKSGAMENWGLITYREAYIHYSEDQSEAEKKSVATIHAHELAHQWFGNLITMTWWSNTWLKEGFAQFFQYYALAEAYPEWRMMEQLLVDAQQTVFVFDAAETAKPLTHDVTTFEEISGQFGTITYRKGASLLRMILNIWGEENFRDALRSHLRARLFGTVEPPQLWSALQEFLPSDIELPEPDKYNGRERNNLTVALETWTLKPGFPVLHVMRNYDEDTVTFSQERFLSNGKRDDETKYWIPVTWSAKGDTTERKTYVLPDEKNVTIEDLGPIDKYTLVHSQGYYRVNYDAENWLSLALTLIWENKDDIAASDRAQLVDDAFTLAHAGYTPYSHVVPLLQYLRTEEDPLPWVAAFRAFNSLDRLLAQNDTEGLFHYFIQESIGLLYKGIGLKNEGTHLHRVHQANIILWSCRSGHADCLEHVVKAANDHFNEEITIKPHLRTNVLCYAIRNNTDDFWQKAIDRLNTTDRSTLLSALTCTRDEERLKELLNLELLDGELVPLVTNLNSNPEGLKVSLEFFIDNFDNISDSGTAVSILRSFGDRITSQDNQEKLENFLDQILEENEKEDINEKLVTEIKGAITENLEWLEKYGEDAIAAFNTEIPTTTTTTTTPKPGGDGGQSTIEPVPILLISALFAWVLRNV